MNAEGYAGSTGAMINVVGTNTSGGAGGRGGNSSVEVARAEPMAEAEAGAASGYNDVPPALEEAGSRRRARVLFG